ncbi:MAG: AAA family ATPase [Thermomicrobiales bacterium]
MADHDLSPAQFGTAFKAFMDAVVAAASPPTSPLLERLRAHLGTDPTQLPVVSEEFDVFEHPNVQVALDTYLEVPGRRAEIVGVAADNKRFMVFGLSDLISRRGNPNVPPLTEGPVDYVNFHLARGRILTCVQIGLHLIAEGDSRLVALVTGPSEHGPRPKVRVEVLAADREAAQAFLAELVETMARRNVYRGEVISISPGQFGPGPQSLVAFHNLPNVGRDDVVLPDGVLERIERHTITFAEHAEQLLAAGRSLKRGLLMYGPPGVGKTLTVMHLVGRMPSRTTILTTGIGMGLFKAVAQFARTLAPAMVVLEDVDLIAEERNRPFAGGPLLFELLNEMDGLRDDCDVIFVLTTNRPEILEPALAARPGRIDLAVELPLPDAAGRRRLLNLYAHGLDVQDADLEALVQRTDGASPAYIKELLRKAAIFAAADGAGMTVTAAHIDAALAELAEGGRLAQRLLGFHVPGEPPQSFQPHPMGFPPGKMPPMPPTQPRRT